MGRIQQQWSFRKYRKFSDEEWLKVLLDSVEGTATVPMPSFPDPSCKPGSSAAPARTPSAKRGTSTP